MGASVQPTAGSQGVRISFSNAGYTTFGGGVRVLANHSIRQFPLHFPSRASLCATGFRTSSNVVASSLRVISKQEDETVCWFETWGTDNPLTQFRIPEERNFQLHFCENLKTSTVELKTEDGLSKIRCCFFYDRMTVHRNRFLVNKTNRCTEFQFYWHDDSTCFGQPFCPSSGVLSRTSVPSYSW